MRVSGVEFVRAAAFAALLLSSIFAWADQVDCQASLVEASDQSVLDARAIASLLDMGEVRGFIEELTGVKSLSSGFRMRTRNSPETRTIARLVLKDYIERMGYGGVRIDPFEGGANVIVDLPGTGRETGLIEVTAHYDSVVTGADDNGSGVALLLGMLGLFRQVEHDRPLRFVFMDLEERGMRGSAYHARQVTRGGQGNADQMAGALVIDTIGWAHPESKKFLGVLELGVAHNDESARRVEFGRELLYALHRGGGLEGLLVSPETTGAMPGTTDLGPYWDHQLPAVLWAAAYEHGFINPHYHRDTDTLENMNWDYYRRMSEAAVQMVAYASKMRLKRPNMLSERAWTVLREQEDRSIAKDKFKVPAAANRADSLGPQHTRRLGSIMDFDDDEPPSKPKKKSVTGKASKYNKVEKVKQYKDEPPRNAEENKNSSPSPFLPHIDRYLSIVNSAPGDTLVMVEMPKTWQGYNRAFAVANGQVLDLVADTDQALAAIRNKVWEKNGVVYRAEPSDTPMPEVWSMPSIEAMWGLVKPVVLAHGEVGTVIGHWDNRTIRLTKIKPSGPFQ